MGIFKCMIVIVMAYVFNVSANNAVGEDEYDSPIGTPLPQVKRDLTQAAPKKQDSTKSTIVVLDKNRAEAKSPQNPPAQESPTNPTKEKPLEIPAEAQTNITIPYKPDETEQEYNNTNPQAADDDSENK